MSIRVMPLLAGAMLALVFVACEREAPEAGTFSYATESTSPTDDDARVALDGVLFKCEGRQVEAACGQCQFGLEGEGCALAVRVGPSAWFVDGTGIDDHGDAHADDGFCNSVRKAVVSGRVAEGRFVATAFELVPANGEG